MACSEQTPSTQVEISSARGDDQLRRCFLTALLEEISAVILKPDTQISLNLCRSPQPTTIVLNLVLCLRQVCYVNIHPA